MGQNDVLLVDKAYEEIRKWIFSGEYRPGEKLSTREIGVRLGMSRTPVVAAINRLVAQGLATEMPRRGVVVSKLQLGQIRDSIDVRKMMEQYAVPYAIKNAKFFPDIIDEMELLAKELQQLSDTSYEQITAFENSFHINYIKLVNNQQLLRLYKSNMGIVFATYTYLIANAPIKCYQQSCLEHFEYVECLRNGDESGLCAVTSRHLDFVYSMLNFLSNSNSSEYWK